MGKTKTARKIKQIKLDKIADTIPSQLRGLMFRREPISILFKFMKDSIYPVHSWFVFFEFDLLYLDSEYKIIEVYQRVPPFSYIRPKNKARYILEIPSGDVKRLRIRRGQRIKPCLE